MDGESERVEFPSIFPFVYMANNFHHRKKKTEENIKKTPRETRIVLNSRGCQLVTNLDSCSKSSELMALKAE